jgi:hypothetical protein
LWLYGNSCRCHLQSGSNEDWSLTSVAKRMKFATLALKY